MIVSQNHYLNKILDVHPLWRECSPPTTCHMSHVMCVSCVTCHVSRVTCHVSCVTCIFFLFRQIFEAYRWRVCYQQGLPRLVSSIRPVRRSSPSGHLQGAAAWSGARERLERWRLRRRHHHGWGMDSVHPPPPCPLDTLARRSTRQREG